MDFKHGRIPSGSATSVAMPPPQAGSTKSQAALAAALRSAKLDDAAELAQAMLSGLKDGKLDLRGNVTAQALAEIPKQAWQALDRAAQEQSGAITDLALPALVHADRYAELCRRLGGLSGLRRLSMELSQAGRHADLSGLPASVRSVELDVPRRDVELTVVAKPDVRVYAAARDHAVLAPVNVGYAGKRADKPRRLQGLAFVRTPVALDGKASGHEGQEAIRRRDAAAIDKNKEASFEGSIGQLARARLPDIMCRHLATQWVIDRLAIRAWEGKSTRMPDFYRHFDNERAITERTPPEVEQIFSQLVQQTKDKPRCTSGEFGTQVAALMSNMNAGDTHQYLLLTPTHAMALELRRKQHADGDYVEEVRLYDPNRTAADICVQVASLGDLKGRPVRTWLVLGATSSAPENYFSGADELTFVHVDSTTLEAARSSLGKPLPILISGGKTDMAASIAAAMEAADQEALRQAVDAVTQSVHRDRVLPILLAPDSEGTPALVRAVHSGQEQQMRAYVQVMLEAARLSAQVRRELVTGTWRDSANVRATAWDHQAALRHPRATLAWWGCVLDSTLDISAIRELMSARRPGVLHFDLYARPTRMPGPHALKLQRQLLCALVLKIAVNTRFTPEQVVQLCWGGPDISVRALVQDDNCDPEHILGSQAEVVRALKRAGRSPEDTAWLIKQMAPDWTEPKAKKDGKG